MPAPAASSTEGIWTRDQWIAYRRSQWDRLVEKRRQVDHRFDPEKYPRPAASRGIGYVDETVRVWKRLRSR